jgi:hypothetical protein
MRAIGRLNLLAAAALGVTLAAGTAACARTPGDVSQAPADAFVAQTFPATVGGFTRASAVMNVATAGTDARNSATAKYTSSAGDVEWKATAFATSESALAVLKTTVDSYVTAGAKVAGTFTNAEGSVRYAALTSGQDLVYCWVDKQQKNPFYLVTGQQPSVGTFMQLQRSW